MGGITMTTSLHERNKMLFGCQGVALAVFRQAGRDLGHRDRAIQREARSWLQSSEAKRLLGNLMAAMDHTGDPGDLLNAMLSERNRM